MIDPPVVEYYKEMRSAFFLSSLTLGTFLFSMKAFIVQTLKKEVYDDPRYQAEVRARLKEFEGTRREGKEGFYTQLRGFARILMVSIFMALISAVLHGTIGFFNAVWSSWLCIFVTALSWFVFLWALVLVSHNISKMLNLSEDKASREKTKHKVGN